MKINTELLISNVLFVVSITLSNIFFNTKIILIIRTKKKEIKLIRY